MTTIASALVAAGYAMSKPNRHTRNCKRKFRFTSKEATHKFVRGNGWKLYTYRCPVCDGWHLTKRAQWNVAQ